MQTTCGLWLRQDYGIVGITANHRQTRTPSRARRATESTL